MPAQRFDRFMADALYGPTGFYASGGRAGRRGDFLTAVEVGPLFGAVTARALDGWWDHSGRPDPFVVEEWGAGRGQWCRMVRRASPACADALRWRAVEIAEPLRRRAAEVADEAVAPPSTATAHVVLANELLDNLPVRVGRRDTEGWSELWVDDAAPVWRAVDGFAPDVADVAGPTEGDPWVVPWPEAAVAWVNDAVRRLEPGGRVVCFDYGATTAELAGRGIDGWLRTYAAHGRGTEPWTHRGSQDITADVAHDQLPGSPDVIIQADWLRAHGLDDLVAEGERVWAERAHLGDLAAVEGRSRRTEAAALTDPDGMGSFLVLTWTIR